MDLVKMGEIDAPELTRQEMIVLRDKLLEDGQFDYAVLFSHVIAHLARLIEVEHQLHDYKHK